MLDNLFPSNANFQWNGKYIHFETVSTLEASLVKGNVFFALLVRFCLPGSRRQETIDYGCKIFWFRDKILEYSVKQKFFFQMQTANGMKIAF